MADRRKLLADIDKTLKKVGDGQKAFQDIFEKFNETNNQSQKEKYEQELKKEIKKLQRYREQIKSWQTSSDIKDKSSLADARRNIEHDMERFKVIEKETKTKAYSKEGLGAEQKKDPAQVQKEETMDWVKSQISSLETQVEKLEYDIEVVMNSKKKKLDRDKQDTVDTKKELISKHKFHIQRLEAVMRMLDNDKLDPEKVKTIQEDVEYYVNNNEDVDFDLDAYDDEIYTDLELEDIGDMSTAGILAASPHDSMDNEVPVPPLLPPATSSSTVSTTSSALTSIAEPIKTSAPSTPAPTPQMFPFPQAPAPAHPSSPPAPQPQVSEPPLPPLMPAPPLPVISSGPATFSSQFSSQLSHNSETGVALDASTSSSVQETSPLRLSQDTNPASSMNSKMAMNFADVEPMEATTARSRSLSSDSNSAAPRAMAQSLSSFFTDSSQMPMPMEKTPQPADLKQLTQAIVEQTQPSQAYLAPGYQPPKPPSQQQQLYTVQLDPMNIAAPMRAQTPPRMQEALSKLENGYKKLPYPADSERFRLHTTPNPLQLSSNTNYPQVPPPGMDTEDFYMKLDPQTLFFIFYYFEGTKAQFLAAKALKKMSWRFHTKYFMWFQRHEEPKTITEEYEKGAYVYYDFEKAMQKKKDNFVFEYKYLEDKEL